jgi:hypothetical protein
MFVSRLGLIRMIRRSAAEGDLKNFMPAKELAEAISDEVAPWIADHARYHSGAYLLRFTGELYFSTVGDFLRYVWSRHGSLTTGAWRGELWILRQGKPSETVFGKGRMIQFLHGMTDNLMAKESRNATYYRNCVAKMLKAQRGGVGRR